MYAKYFRGIWTFEYIHCKTFVIIHFVLKSLLSHSTVVYIWFIGIRGDKNCFRATLIIRLLFTILHKIFPIFTNIKIFHWLGLCLLWFIKTNVSISKQHKSKWHNILFYLFSGHRSIISFDDFFLINSCRNF